MVTDCYTTWWEQRQQQAAGGVAVASVQRAADDGLMERRTRGAQQADFFRTFQTAALKHNPTAADFNRREALGTVALRGLEAFRAFTNTHQVFICGRQEVSPPDTSYVGSQQVFTEHLKKVLIIQKRIRHKVPEPSADVSRTCRRSSSRTWTLLWPMFQCTNETKEKQQGVQMSALLQSG